MENRFKSEQFLAIARYEPTHECDLCFSVTLAQIV